MKLGLRTAMAGALFLLPCAGQQWEIGASGLFGFPRGLDVTRAGSIGSAGFANGFAAGVVAAHHPRRYLGGEFRYTYRASDLKVSSGGRDYRFPGDSHAIHYDILLHTQPLGARIRPFVAAGGGIKVFRGTGEEDAGQPLRNVALLTRTQEITPLLSFGGGVSARVSQHFVFRAEFRDYFTPFPQEVIAPAPGAQIRGFLHDLVPLVGVGIVF